MASPSVLLALLAAAAVLAAVQACLLPPEGCKKQVCDSYAGFIMPRNLNYSALSSWGGWNGKLAYVRTSFNKKYGQNGPSRQTPESWLSMKDGLRGVPGGPPTLPSLNYEYYSMTMNGTIARRATASVGGYAPGASLASCCNACRLDADCPMYFYDPVAAAGQADTLGGACWFITKGAVVKDGPFDYVDPTDPKSPRTVNLMAPEALSRSETAVKVKNDKAFPSYSLGFLGGYCNNHEFPNGTVTDDPHFMGAHGTRFDFNGELDRAFCLLTDKSLHLNAVLKGYKSDNTVGATVGKDGKAVRSWIKEVGLMWTASDGVSHSLHLVARNGKAQERGAGFLAEAELDGEPLEVPQIAGGSVSVGEFTISFLGTARKGWYDVDRFQVVVGDQLDLSLHMRVAHPKLQSENDAQAHFNLMFNDVKVTEAVHGVLGQTYRNTPSQIMKSVKYSELSKLLGAPIKADGQTGQGFLDGAVGDYESTGVLKTDCAVSSFTEQ